MTNLKCPSCGDTPDIEKNAPIKFWTAKNQSVPVAFYKCDKCGRVWNVAPFTNDS